MTPTGLILIVISVTLSALGQTAFKAGVDRISFADGVGVVEKSMGFLTSPWILAGLAAYGVGTLFWLFALKELDLSLAYPFVALSFVVVFLIGIFVLGEPVVATRVIGLLIIILGLVVMARA